MKKNQKKKFRIGCIFSIITSLIMISVSLPPLGDIDRFSRLIMLVPLSIAAWLFFLGRENVFDLTYTGGRHDIYDEDYVDDTEGGFLEHCIKAAFVFVPLCAIDTFIFFGHSIAKGLYWLVPVLLIILNIIEIMPEKKSSKDDENKTTELATKDVDEKSSALKNIEVIKVEGARAQYYFEEVRGTYLFTCNVYKTEGDTATNKLYDISGPMMSNIASGLLSMSDNNGGVIGCVDCQDTTTQDAFEIRDTHEIGASGKIKYKMFGGAFTDCTIIDPDGNKLAYYKVISAKPKRQEGIYGPNDEPYAVLYDNKILSIMENCPIDDKHAMFIIALVLRNNAVNILGLW